MSEELEKEKPLPPLRGGWFGLLENVLYVLSIMKADVDEKGAYLIYEAPVVQGLDPSEAVVPGESEYSVGGKRMNLAGALNSTSYGLKVTVIS
jgi:hypothetical protein